MEVDAAAAATATATAVVETTEDVAPVDATEADTDMADADAIEEEAKVPRRHIEVEVTPLDEPLKNWLQVTPSRRSRTNFGCWLELPDDDCTGTKHVLEEML